MKLNNGQRKAIAKTIEAQYQAEIARLNKCSRLSDDDVSIIMAQLGVAHYEESITALE